MVPRAEGAGHRGIRLGGDLTDAGPRPQGSIATSQHTRVWYVVLLLTVVNIFNYMDRTALSVLLPEIQRDFSLSDVQVGLLAGFAFSLFYAIGGIPIARISDRGNRTIVVSLSLAAWSLMTAAGGLAANFSQLFVARIGVGVGEAGGLPAAQSILCDYVPPARQTSVFAIHSFGLVVGMMMGLFLAGWTADHMGWRGAFFILGLPGMVFALLVFLTLKEPVRIGGPDSNADRRPPALRLVMTHLIRNKTYICLAAFSILLGFSQYGLGQWWPTLYERTYQLGSTEVGLHLGLAAGAGSGLGLLAGAFLGALPGKDSRERSLLIGAATTALACPAALASLFSPTVVTASLWVFLTNILWCISNGAVIAAMYNVVRSNMRATSASISILATALLGFGSGPFIVGFVSQQLAPLHGDRALSLALVAPATALLFAAAALVAAVRWLAKDELAAGNLERTWN